MERRRDRPDNPEMKVFALIAAALLASFDLAAQEPMTGKINSIDGDSMQIVPGTVRVYKLGGVTRVDALVDAVVKGKDERDRYAITGCDDGEGVVLSVYISGQQMTGTNSFQWALGGRKVFDVLAYQICSLGQMELQKHGLQELRPQTPK